MYFYSNIDVVMKGAMEVFSGIYIPAVQRKWR